MARHMVAFYESAYGITDEEINVVPDSVITQDGDTRFVVPANLNKLDFAYASATDLTKARIFAPSAERKRTILYLNKLSAPLGSTASGDPRCVLHRGYIFDPTEDVSLRVTVGGAAAEDIVGVLQLWDGNEPAIPNGEIRMVRATASVTLTAFKWTLVTPTFDEQLEAGTYALIGFLPISAGCIAARVILPGQVYRPGVMGFAGTETDALKASRNDIFEKHLYGVFDHKNPPQFEFLSSSADTSEVIYMLLVKTG